VATYGDVAALAGRPRAARAVGNIMRGCGDRSIPCHRVIAAAGQLGGYGGNIGLKRELLKAEGLILRGMRVARFEQVRWKVKETRARRAPLVATATPQARRRL
jgi:O-6-methylguanine DNA methyltransferase